jgi:hypothetical protein
VFPGKKRLVCFLPFWHTKSFEMKATKRIIAGISFATVVGLVIYLVAQRRKVKRMEEQIADHGYETAHDILFPKKNFRGRKNIYGPVHPS